jgi:uncharacterized protein (TIGR03083 family)
VVRHSVVGMTIDHLTVLDEQSALFNAAARRPDALRRPVSACPGWTVADLVEHLGEVQVFWTHTVEAGGDLPDEDTVRAQQKPTDGLLRWGEQCSSSLVKTLRDTPLHAASWCWWNAERRASVAEVASRQAHEALIHRWDAEAATGRQTPAEPALWSDGVDEFATRFLNGQAWSGPSGVVAMRADDVGREWLFGVGSASTREGGKPVWLRDRQAREPDVLATGTAEQLDLLLWRRTEVDLGQIKGDPELVAAFVAWADLD